MKQGTDGALWLRIQGLSLCQPWQVPEIKACVVKRQNQIGQETVGFCVCFIQR
jgi:hypothetical protein